MTHRNRILSVDAAKALIYRAGLSPVSVSTAGETVLATIEPVTHNDKPVLDQAASVQKKLADVGACMTCFSVQHRLVQFTVAEGEGVE